MWKDIRGNQPRDMAEVGQYTRCPVQSVNWRCASRTDQGAGPRQVFMQRTAWFEARLHVELRKAGSGM